MKQETVPEQVTVPPTPTPNKAKQRETTYAGKLGDWQRILATLAANAADLPHLEIPRAQLAAFLTQAVRQHYGPRSPKLAEFNLKVFRGRTPNPASTPEPPTPPPAVELTTTPLDTVSKAPSVPTHLA